MRVNERGETVWQLREIDVTLEQAEDVQRAVDAYRRIMGVPHMNPGDAIVRILTLYAEEKSR